MAEREVFDAGWLFFTLTREAEAVTRLLDSAASSIAETDDCCDGEVRNGHDTAWFWVSGFSARGDGLGAGAGAGVNGPPELLW